MGKLQKLKSLIKLNKLFHYEFKIPKELFYTLKIHAYFITVDDDYIKCYGNKKLFQTLIKYDVLYKDQHKLFFKKVFLKRIIMIITFILICLVFYSSSYFIREVKFKNPAYYDYRVYRYVINRLDKKLFLYTLDTDLNDLSLSLKANFPNYAYIGITKKGGTLEIEIEKIDIKNNVETNAIKLPIISNYNAVIYGISCQAGVVLVNLNQSVKKGEVLVTPNSDEGFCDAVILGSLAEYETVKVKKEKIYYGFTGKLVKKYALKVGNNYLMKFKNYFTEQDVKTEKVFSIFNYIELSKIIYYEKDYYKIKYDYESAYNYAVSLFYKNLELYRKSNLEKINEIKLLSCEENEDEFIFYFLINRIKSIGIYSYNN